MSKAKPKTLSWEAANALILSLERMLVVQEALMPGVKHIAVQNYAELNDAPIAACKALNAARAELKP